MTSLSIHRWPSPGDTELQLSNGKYDYNLEINNDCWIQDTALEKN